MDDPRARSDARQAVPEGITLRTELRPGDLGEIVRLHGVTYAREHGFDATFEAYVAGPLAEFVRAPNEGDRLWIAGDGQSIAGCTAILAASAEEAQLRWFLVAPAWRGRGLGRLLLRQALAFCEERRYGRIFLWTVEALAAASRLYREADFRVVERRPGRRWGSDVVEEKHVLDLRRKRVRADE